MSTLRIRPMPPAPQEAPRLILWRIASPPSSPLPRSPKAILRRFPATSTEPRKRRPCPRRRTADSRSVHSDRQRPRRRAVPDLTDDEPIPQLAGGNSLASRRAARHLDDPGLRPRSQHLPDAPRVPPAILLLVQPGPQPRIGDCRALRGSTRIPGPQFPADSGARLGPQLGHSPQMRHAAGPAAEAPAPLSRSARPARRPSGISLLRSSGAAGLSADLRGRRIAQRFRSYSALLD